MLYSKSTGGFYSTEIHGVNTPEDAVQISTEHHAALLSGQSGGKLIVANDAGHPILIDPPAPTPNELIIAQIAALEATVSERRYREAVLGIDGGWLTSLNDQIVALRAQLQ